MDFAGAANPLSNDGISQAADRLGVDAARIWAVLRVETQGCGFLVDRRPQILFERHWFHRQTGGTFSQAAPDISNPTPGGYGSSGAAQYARLERAIALDRRAALRSASWGIGQVMGFHAESLGFSDVEALVTAMRAGEDEQLRAMTNFIVAENLHRPLQEEDWVAFARGYNGSDFAKNQYDVRLRHEYADIQENGPPDLQIRTAQVQLMFRGFNPGPIDGQFGNLTRGAVRRFQVAVRLPVTGDLDAPTVAALQKG